jgi:hypothetical protein
MIRLHYEGYDYNIDFSHSCVDDKGLDIETGKKLPRTTSCSISQVEVVNNAENIHEEVGYGVAWCSPNDQFVKETGRKIALQRALDEMFGFSWERGNEERKNREVFWLAYHNRQNMYINPFDY